ncbi:MAG: fatty acid desaturase [Alphaproteobacteria bacterium]
MQVDDFVGVRNVLEPRRLRELSERSDTKGLFQAATHLGAIAATTTALALTWGTWWAAPFFFLQGILLVQLYAAEHECYHATAFKSRWLNDWFGRLFGFINFYPSDYDKWQHFAHHRHTQDWEKDTELLKRKPYTSPWQLVWVLSGLPFFYYRLKSIIGHAVRHIPEKVFTPKQTEILVLSARLHLLGYALIAASAVAMESWWPLIYWVGPMVSAKWVYWLQGISEHTATTHYPNTLLNTRTFKTNAFMRWVHWNMVYHTVHHTFPSVPFHRLPELHREVSAKYPHPLPVVTYWGCFMMLFRELRRGRTEHDMVRDADAAFAARMGLQAKAAE